MRKPGSTRDPLWYKDAVIYELHVRTFFDGNGDGVGDFAGLTQKLGYFERLGVTCLWLLPFYESPLRDDGYDIAHYERVHPQYGTLDDFRTFLEAAHARGLQVITELVVNHTSDRHPWFQAARRAPAGSHKRDFYVWSDTDQRYLGARVIFGDVEPSNWTWDPVARAFYWHRFFHHQPDLNFDNPEVRQAVLKVMRFWFDMGVDGLRLDAVSHLFEREGTNCDNLPETHAFLKEIRADLDQRYEGRVLLAEANQGPEELKSYFGAGDECHMAFHFPLMPRLFQALAQEEASPVADILRQTQGLPATCQWAVFLRNHDELSLSAIAGPDREWLCETYAPGPRMRLNHGIRRRLAPLLGHDRAAIELAHLLLLSLPGSPVLYYGDEIGMGDNVYLDDRDGVRTPMQWTAGVNGGFSIAPAARLTLPPIDDPEFGYLAVNVEAQDATPGSLLAWMRRVIAIRRQYRAFGRGSLELLRCGNPNVLAFARRYGDELITVAANLARSPQESAIEFPASAAGLPAVNVLDGDVLPSIDSVRTLTFGPQACHWLQVVASPDVEALGRWGFRLATDPSDAV